MDWVALFTLQLYNYNVRFTVASLSWLHYFHVTFHVTLLLYVTASASASRTYLKRSLPIIVQRLAAYCHCYQLTITAHLM